MSQTTHNISVMDLPITDPIHKPCPDMAGCENPDPALTQRSIEAVQRLRAKLAEQMTRKKVSHIPARFRQGGDA